MKSQMEVPRMTEAHLRIIADLADDDRPWPRPTDWQGGRRQMQYLRDIESLVQSHLDTPPSPKPLTRYHLNTIDVILGLRLSALGDNVARHKDNLREIRNFVESGDTPGVRVPKEEITRAILNAEQGAAGTASVEYFVALLQRWLSRGTP